MLERSFRRHHKAGGYGSRLLPGRHRKRCATKLDLQLVMAGLDPAIHLS
jgi:hypothetical protein